MLRTETFSPAFKEMLYKTIQKESNGKYITHRISKARNRRNKIERPKASDSKRGLQINGFEKVVTNPGAINIDQVFAPKK
jgi:hypothetical protein